MVSLVYAALLTGWQVGLILAPILFTHLQARRFQRSGASQLRLTLVLVLGFFILLKGSMLALLMRASLDHLVAYVPFASINAGPGLLPLGISYCLFRLIHYIVEVHRGRLPVAPLWALTLFVLWFPTFRAGPIHRMGTFTPASHPRPQQINTALFRIISGLTKKVLLVDLLMVGHLAAWLQAQPLGLPLQQLTLAYFLTLMVYLDFSGYSDLAIGVSSVFGYQVMENFDYPLARSNPAQFWRSWHISLYTFIRDYFFLPVFGRAATFNKMLLGLFLCFTLSQVWHAFTLNFLLLGTYHGALMAGWALFERWRKRSGLAAAGRLGRALWWIVTFHLVAAGFLLFFWGRMPGS